MNFYYLVLKGFGTKCVLEVHISAFKSQAQGINLYTGLEYTSGLSNGFSLVWPPNNIELDSLCCLFSLWKHNFN